jgi:hypothetical protein
MIDKNYWFNLHFREGKSFNIKCPTCEEGKLNILGNFAVHETKYAIELQKDLNYDIEELAEKFSGLLVCDNKYCNDIVTVSGNASPVRIYDEEDYSNQLYYKLLRPEFFSPPLKIFPLKQEYPARVRDILEKSFSLFFVDSDSCGNKIRISVEALLDELGVECKKGESLHARIKNNKKTNDFVREIMLSIKWIGNYGSHNDSISRIDLLDAYEMMNAILDELYDNYSNKLKALSKSINDNKKPLSAINNF